MPPAVEHGDSGQVEFVPSSFASAALTLLSTQRALKAIFMVARTAQCSMKHVKRNNDWTGHGRYNERLKLMKAVVHALQSANSCWRADAVGECIMVKGPPLWKIAPIDDSPTESRLRAHGLPLWTWLTRARDVQY